jgi:hypothetical protein
LGGNHVNLGRSTDSLLIVVIGIGVTLVALVAYLGVIDYFHPVSDVRLGSIYPPRTPKRHS